MTGFDTAEPPVGIVPALDLQTVDELRRVVRETCQVEGIVEYKLGLQAVLHIGLFQAVDAVRELTDLPIVYDHQKAGADMPDSAAGFAEICSHTDIEGLIIFPVAGPTAVREFVGNSLAHGLQPVVGGHIPVPDYGISGGGYMADDALERIIALAAETGASRFVLPANDPARIERTTKWLLDTVADPVLYLTGIGPLGGSITESFAAARGMPIRRAVIGRRICSADDPAAATAAFFQEMLDVG
jgi:orotidine-5'-phosphate decarboxylase